MFKRLHARDKARQALDSSDEEEPMNAGESSPLSDVVVLVDVVLQDRSFDAIEGIENKLRTLGAKVVKRPVYGLTHLVWKDGKNRKTLESVWMSGNGSAKIVSPLWVQECFDLQEVADSEEFEVPLSSTDFLKPVKKRKSVDTGKPAPKPKKQSLGGEESTGLAVIEEGVVNSMVEEVVHQVVEEQPKKPVKSKSSKPKKESKAAKVKKPKKVAKPKKSDDKVSAEVVDPFEEPEKIVPRKRKAEVVSSGESDSEALTEPPSEAEEGFFEEISAAPRKPRSRKQSLDPRRVLGTSGVDSDTRQVAHDSGNLLGFKKVVYSAAELPSHLIAPEGMRTFKILNAIATGAWVLRPQALWDSISQGEWVSEEDYEITGFIGAKQSRLAHLRKDEPLLQGKRVCVLEMSERVAVSRLVGLLGGIISASFNSCDYVLAGSEEQAVRALRTTKAPVVHPLWLYDSVQDYAVKDTHEYGFLNPQEPESPEL